MHRLNLVPYAQSYPSLISQVTPRTGYKCRIEKSDLISQLDSNWSARLNFAIESASKIVPLAVVDLDQQKRKDEELWNIITAQEKKAKLETKRWENIQAGKVGKDRFQRTDGVWDAAGIVILGHYPPTHGSGHAFTASKDGTRMLGMDGVQSASLSGNFQMAFSNLLPVFFDVDHMAQSLTIKNPTGSKTKTTSYPQRVINECINYHAKELLDRLANGASQFHFAFGSNPGKVHASVALTAAEKKDEIKMRSVQVRCRVPRLWEMAVMSLEMLLLCQRHGGASSMVGEDKNLFNNQGLDDMERRAVKADKSGIPLTPNTSITIDLVLLSHVNHPDRCMVLVSSDHMTAATSVPKGGNVRIAPRTDIITTLLEDIYFARLGGILFPRPSWKFTSRRIQSQLDVGNKASVGQYAGLGEGTRELLGRLNASRTGDVRAAYLPPSLKRMYEGIELRADPKGVEVNPANVVDRLLIADDLRVKKMAEVSARKQ